MMDFDEKKMRKVISDSVFWGILRAAMILVPLLLALYFVILYSITAVPWEST